jgi:hypothetical protein
MDRQESQRNWPDMRKTLGKPGFCSRGFRKQAEMTGTELFDVFPMFLRSSRGAFLRSTVIENEEPLSTTASPRKA